MTLLKLLNRS